MYNNDKMSKEIDIELQNKYEVAIASIKDGSATATTYINAAAFLNHVKNHPDKGLFDSFLEKAFVLAQKEYRDYEKRDDAVLVLAQYYDFTENYEKAAEYYTEAAKKDPENYCMLIPLYMLELHDKKRALAAFEEAKAAGLDNILLNMIDPNNSYNYIRTPAPWLLLLIGIMCASAVILYILAKFYL